MEDTEVYMCMTQKYSLEREKFLNEQKIRKI